MIILQYKWRKKEGERREESKILITRLVLISASGRGGGGFGGWDHVCAYCSYLFASNFAINLGEDTCNSGLNCRGNGRTGGIASPICLSRSARYLAISVLLSCQLLVSVQAFLVSQLTGGFDGFTERAGTGLCVETVCHKLALIDLHYKAAPMHIVQTDAHERKVSICGLENES